MNYSQQSNQFFSIISVDNVTEVDDADAARDIEEFIASKYLDSTANADLIGQLQEIVANIK